MSLEATIYSTLNALAPTWPTLAKAGTTPPYITYQLVAGADISGYEANGTGARFGRWQIDCWATDYGAARNLSEVARDALYAALTVGEITDNPSDYENTTELHRASFDVKAWQ